MLLSYCTKAQSKGLCKALNCERRNQEKQQSLFLFKNPVAINKNKTMYLKPTIKCSISVQIMEMSGLTSINNGYICIRYICIRVIVDRPITSLNSKSQFFKYSKFNVRKNND